MEATIEPGSDPFPDSYRGEENFRLLADNAPVMIWRSGTDKLCDWFNKPWLDFTGRTLEQELGNGWAQGVHADDFDRCIAIYSSAFDRRQEFSMEYRLRRHDGVHRWILDNGRPFFSRSREFRGYFGSAIDIDDRKQAEAAAEAQRREIARLMRVSALGELSGAVAHEVNQPLASILMNADAAREMLAHSSPDLGMVKEILGDIVEEGVRAGEAVRRLRLLLRRGERKSDPVDMNAVVEATLALLRGEFIERRIRVDVALAEPLPMAVGDPIQLQQALFNVLMNAMEAMGSTSEAQRVIEVATRRAAAGPIEVEVLDHGPGIVPDAREKLFQAFFTTKEHGLGLGLPISFAILNSHGGKLSISNIADGGSAAVLSLPAHEDAGVASTSGAAPV